MKLLLALAFMVAGACWSPTPAADPRPLRIATGPRTSVYDPLGRALAHVYNTRLPDVAASAIETTGSVSNVKAVEEGRVEVAFTQADVAYFAFQHPTGASGPYRKLRAIAVLYTNAVQMVVLRASDIQHVSDLRGRRVGVGAVASGTEVAAHVILQAYGLERQIASEPVGFDDLAERLQRRRVDAGFVVSSYPVPAIGQVNAAAGVRLLSVDADVAGRLRGEYPFFRPLMIPAGSYEGQLRDVVTMGVDNLLVCQRDLPDALVHQLTRVLFESLPELSRAHVAAAAIDPERAPAAPIPIHPGAARFYRQRELFR